MKTKKRAEEDEKKNMINTKSALAASCNSVLDFMVLLFIEFI
jgi:hypothetical protein